MSRDWNRFVRDGLKEDGDVNTVYDFPKMTKLFGRAYLDYLVGSYAAKGDMPDDEWCRVNGNVPPGFLTKIKDGRL